MTNVESVRLTVCWREKGAALDFRSLFLPERTRDSDRLQSSPAWGMTAGDPRASVMYSPVFSTHFGDQRR